MVQRVALPAGTYVGGYRVANELGRGGFGITYRAVTGKDGPSVALKEFYPQNSFIERVAGSRSLQCTKPNQASDYAKGLENVEREAKTLLLFRQANIVRVTQLLRENNTLYLVLAFENGVNLREWVRQLGRLPSQAELDRLLPPMLEALRAIHKNKMLHRDIAPDNIYIRPNDEPVLLDFGSARSFEGYTVAAGGMTGIVKHGYSPHEQYHRDATHQGPWTDIYALGATLYDIMTDGPPPECMQRWLECRARGLDSYRPIQTVTSGHYRPGFLDAIDCALELEPARRPQDIRQWQAQLFATGPGRPQKVARGQVPSRPKGPSSRPPPLPQSGRRGFLSKFADWFR